MKHALYKLTIIFICTVTLAGKSNSLTTLYNDAVRFSPDLETVKATVEQSIGVKFEQYYNFVPLPLINYDVNNNEFTYKDGSKRDSHPNALTVAISQSVSAPKIFNTISANKAADSSKAALDAEHSSLLNSVIGQYANVLSSYESLMALKTQAAYLKKVYEQEKQKLRLGASTKANVAQAKTSYDVVVAQQVDAKLSISTGLNQLFLLTGVNYTTLPQLSSDIKLNDTLTLKNIDSYKASTLSDNDNIRASKLNLQANQNQLYSARSGFLPYITYGLTYTNYHDQSDYLPSQTIEESTVTTVGVGLNLANNPGVVMQQQGIYDEAVASNRGVVTDTLTQLSTAYESVLASKEAVRRYENAVKSAKVSLKATQASYNAGSMTLLDVLNSIQELQSNETILAQKRYEYFTYYAGLRALTGESPTQILKTLDQTTSKGVNLRNIAI